MVCVSSHAEVVPRCEYTSPMQAWTVDSHLFVLMFGCVCSSSNSSRHRLWSGERCGRRIGMSVVPEPRLRGGGVCIRVREDSRTVNKHGENV